MRFRSQHRHVIDFIFPIAVFFVFAASSLAVLMLSANIYKETTGQAEQNFTKRTSLSYVSEKIKQNDKDGGISIQNIEDNTCLALSQNYQESSYTTYIYEYEGYLKELFIRDGIDISLKDGKDIMEIRSFGMKEIKPKLYRFTTVDKNGNETSIIAAERSMS